MRPGLCLHNKRGRVWKEGTSTSVVYLKITCGYLVSAGAAGVSAGAGVAASGAAFAGA